MLTGTVMAQALPLMAAPLLTRLYSPEAFGLQTLFMGLAASLAVLATCRLDLALLLPERDAEVAPVVGFIVCSTLVITILTWLLLPIAEMAIGQKIPVEWLCLLPLTVFLIATYQVGVGLASRRQAFRSIAKATVVNQASYVAAAIAVGFSSGWTLGLVVAKAVGQGAAAMLLGRIGISEAIGGVRCWSFSSVYAAAFRYRQFLIFNTPCSLLGSVARDAPIYIFSALAAMGSAGFFGLARTVLLAPTLLASNAFSLVFYREAVNLRGSQRLQQLTQRLLLTGLTVLAPLFAFCAVWGDVLFVTIFGDDWRNAGIFAMVIAPAAWMAVQTGWPERLFEVNMRQGVSFAVQLGFDAFTAVAFAAAYLVSADAIVAIVVFTICSVLYHHAYLFAIFRVAGFSTKALMHILLLGWLVFALCFAVLASMRLQIGSAVAVSWVAGLTLSSVIAALIGMYTIRKGLNSVSGEI